MIQVPSSFSYRSQGTDRDRAGYVLRNRKNKPVFFCACTESGISSLKTDGSKESRNRMKNEIQDNQTTKTMNFPYGWSKGDICVMITNKAKRALVWIHHRKLRWKVFWCLQPYRVVPSSVSMEDVPYTGGCDWNNVRVGARQDVASVSRTGLDK